MCIINKKRSFTGCCVVLFLFAAKVICFGYCIYSLKRPGAFYIRMFSTLCVCLFVYLSVCLFACLSVCLSVCLSIFNNVGPLVKQCFHERVHRI
jgi:hypothetical protein